MRFVTDDGTFGILVTPLAGSDMFRFQLVIDGRLIGDAEPCFVHAGMAELRELRQLDDERLGLLKSTPHVVLAALLAEEELHDSATLHLAESFDQWLMQGYFYGEDAVIVARGYEDGSPTGPTLISMVSRSEYLPVVDAARAYWAKASGIGR